MNMNCQTFSRQIDDALDGRLDRGLALDHQVHAAACAECGARLDAETLLRQKLRGLPVPLPSSDFEVRVFEAVSRAHPSRQRTPITRVLAYAMAASVIVGVGLALLLDRPEAPVPVVARTAASATSVALNEVTPVRLRFRSPRDLTGVTVDLEFPDGVELAGFPGQRKLSWKTDLQSGANLLDLPIIVRQGEGGTVTASLSIGQNRRQFVVQVPSRAPAGALIPQPATPVAVLAGVTFVNQGGFDHA